MMNIKYICTLVSLCIFGGYDVSASGPKVYNPVSVRDSAPCTICDQCICLKCECSADAPKTEKKVAKSKYLSYAEAVKLAEKDGKEIHVYVGVNPTEESAPNTYVVFEDKLEGYNKGDVVTSKFFGGKHERISLNGVEDKTTHTGVNTPSVTWVRSCNGGTCTMVPVYSQQPTVAQYYVPGVSGGCSTGNCPNR